MVYNVNKIASYYPLITSFNFEIFYSLAGADMLRRHQATRHWQASWFAERIVCRILLTSAQKHRITANDQMSPRMNPRTCALSCNWLISRAQSAAAMTGSILETIASFGSWIGAPCKRASSAPAEAMPRLLSIFEGFNKCT